MFPATSLRAVTKVKSINSHGNTHYTACSHVSIELGCVLAAVLTQKQWTFANAVKKNCMTMSSSSNGRTVLWVILWQNFRWISFNICEATLSREKATMRQSRERILFVTVCAWGNAYTVLPCDKECHTNAEHSLSTERCCFVAFVCAGLWKGMGVNVGKSKYVSQVWCASNCEAEPGVLF